MESTQVSAIHGENAGEETRDMAAGNDFPEDGAPMDEGRDVAMRVVAPFATAFESRCSEEKGDESDGDADYLMSGMVVKKQKTNQGVALEAAYWASDDQDHRDFLELSSYMDILEHDKPASASGFMWSSIGMGTADQIRAFVACVGSRVAVAYAWIEGGHVSSIWASAQWDLLVPQDGLLNRLSSWLNHILAHLLPAIDDMWFAGDTHEADRWERLNSEFTTTQELVEVHNRRIKTITHFNHENFNMQDHRFAESQPHNMTLLECLNAKAFQHHRHKDGSCKTRRFLWLPDDVVGIVRSYLCQFPDKLQVESDAAFQDIYFRMAHPPPSYDDDVPAVDEGDY